MRARGRARVAALVAGLLVAPGAPPAAPAPAAAAWLALTPAQEEEAIRVGQRSVIDERFGGEWRVVDGQGQRVTVFTPFHRLALAARHAAFRNEPLAPRERERVRAELRDRLLLWVELLGPREDFARHLRPRLRVGDREVEPVRVQNEHSALRREDGRYLARCAYWFPAAGLEGDARLVLQVRDPDARLVAEFAIDLGAMR